jgi:uncharacterized SAM-binding protein YcdF (DUF218 family)
MDLAGPLLSAVLMICVSAIMACDLFKQGLAPRLVLSGKIGNWTKHLWNIPKAHIFKARALANGIESNRIYLEDQATNFGENIAFVRKLMPDLESVTFITKPNSALRVNLTVPIQWPGIKFFVDAPGFAFPEEVSNLIGVFGVINEMVGDIDRIIRYPSKGFQLPHQLPQEVLKSWEALVKDGFDHHLLAGKKKMNDPG